MSNTIRFFIAMLAIVAVSAHAVPVNWTISGPLANSASITGTFTYDADTNTYSNVKYRTNKRPIEIKFPD